MRSMAAEVPSAPLAHSIEVAGRVVARSGEEALLRDPSGTVRLVGSQLPELLSLARVRGRWNGAALEVEQCVEEHMPSAFGELRDSELWALSPSRTTRQLLADVEPRRKRGARSGL
jgi:hypothetical protein